MRRAARQIAVLACALLALCVAYRLTTANRYVAVIPIPVAEDGSGEESEYVICVDDEEVVRLSGQEVRDGRMRVSFRALGQGEAYAELRSGSGDVLARHDLRVSRFLTVYDRSNGSFTADTAVIASVTVFFLLVSAIMAHAYITAGWPQFYAYTSVYFAGFSVFSLSVGIMMLIITVRRLAMPERFTMLDAYRAVSSAGVHFMLLTMPFVAVFSILLILSNAVLLKKEGLRPANLLALAAGAALIAGDAAILLLAPRAAAGRAGYLRMGETVLNVCATVYVYFECMLAGAVVCAFKAAGHVPSRDRDFILILGCRFRRDGTLPPLLKSRADKAIEFWKEQRRETGRTARFIPCGGQGRDEAMSEAEAISRYLVSRGVPGELIRKEDRSADTYGNMRFARDIVSARPHAKTVFATSDYHVFRSGVWAGMADLRAEGIGSRTRWWYWPNAFMREAAGLLAKRWKQEIAFVVLLNAFFGALTLALG